MKPLALTMGEPAGIGEEITLKAWQRSRREPVPPFFVIGDPGRFDALARALGRDVPIRECEPGRAAETFDAALPVLPIRVDGTPGPGRPDPAAAPAVIAAIDAAVAAARAGDAGGVVTNPIHKAALLEAGFPHAGHTEYLAALCDTPLPVMMLACPDLRVVPVTVHLALRDALARLDTALIVDTGRIVASSLRRDFGVARPRLAIAGVNPHAGESGRLGREDLDLVAPAVERLRADGIVVRGPLPADTMFHAAARAGYDAALCMYHDQALIPIKTIDFANAVNVTLGLPIVRTSPDHGTAFDIAGRGRADESSLVAALRLAAVMAANRRDAA